MGNLYKYMQVKQKSIKWLSEDGTLIACHEKIKVMTQNLAEFAQMTQDLLDDAAIIGISPWQVKQVLQQIINNLPTLSEEK